METDNDNILSRTKSRKRSNTASHADAISIDNSSPKALLEAVDNNPSNDKWLEIKNIKRNYWKKEEEDLLQEWCDKAKCYEWMHFKTHEKYKSQNTWFTIPVIIISTITGTANFAQDRVPEKSRPYVVMGVGAANIIAGVVTTIHQYLKIAELNESHKIAYNEWGKLYRNIKTEVKKHPFDRENHTVFMKYCKKEYDRLIDSCSSIPKDIVKMFNKKHRKSTIQRPEICHSVNRTEIFEMTDLERQDMVEELNEDHKALEEYKDATILKLNNDIARMNNEYNTLQAEYKRLKDELAQLHFNNNKPIEVVAIDENLEKFKKSFAQFNGRQPTQEEIATLYNEIYLNDNAEMININDGNMSGETNV
jgi:virulence-associated protein VapD